MTMGAFAAYSLYTGIFLLAGYLLYKLAMAGEKQMTLNRAVLWAIYAVAFAAWPLSRIQLHESAPLTGAVDFALAPMGAVESTVSRWPGIITAIYTAGLCAAALVTAVTFIRLALLVRSGQRKEREGYTLVLLPAGKVAPFSWGSYIVMGEDDYSAAGEVVMAHELAHICHHHCIDLLLAQVACIFLWYNPAAWLMREELKTVHEYQADASVLASGIEPRAYQMLLIKKAVGTRFQSLANSLNHSKLKKRITMMYKEKNSGLRRLRGLVLAVAPVVAIAVVNIPAVASAMGSLRAADVKTEKADNTTGNNIKIVGTVKSVKKDGAKAEDKVTEKNDEGIEKFAEFPGGTEEMMKYLINNIKYPKEAVAAKHEGKPLVQFIVQPDGSIDDVSIMKSSGWPELDEEAVRVVKVMARWTPAQNKEGEAVAMSYCIPVFFKLSGKDSGTCPDITVDGKPITESELAKIPSSEIKSMTVKKDDPEHPNGLIIIEMKK